MSQIVAQARAYSSSQLSLIRRTVAKDTSQDEFDLFIEICKQQGLDPFKKQIYAQVYNKDKPDKRQLVIVTSIDGYRSKAQRSGDYRPQEEETKFELDELAKAPHNSLGLVRAVVRVFKYGPDKAWYAVVGEARWDEFAPITEGYDEIEKGDKWPDGNSKKTRVPNGKKTLKAGQWQTMPHVMLSKCAEAQALRRGWPDVMSGLYVQEEMDKVELDMTATEAAEQYDKDERLRRTAGMDTIPAIFEMTEGLQLIPIGKFADRVLEHIGLIETADSFDFWREQNVRGLQSFWAYSPNDAHNLKKEMESAREKLSMKVAS